jgi:hypothetical protein
MKKNDPGYEANTFYENVKNEIKKLFEAGRLNYRKTHTDKSFSFIEHSNLEEDGFKQWKEKLDNEIGKSIVQKHT